LAKDAERYGISYQAFFSLVKEITVSKARNPKTYAKEGGKAHFVEARHLGFGVVSAAATPQGNRVPCYSLERTLVDLVRSRNKGDQDLVPAALKNYAKLMKWKIPSLLECAKIFRIEKIINSICKSFSIINCAVNMLQN
jgi:hypothetical protein